MKHRLRSLLAAPAGRPVVVFGYLCAFIALAVAAHVYLAGAMDIHVFGTIAGLVLAATTFLLNLTGWTIYGFAPIAGFVALRATQAMRNRDLPDHHLRELFYSMELALALGMAGTIWAFIRVGRNYAESGTGDPHTSFMSILMGFGSTFAALLVIMTTLSLIVWFHLRTSRPANMKGKLQ